MVKTKAAIKPEEAAKAEMESKTNETQDVDSSEGATESAPESGESKTDDANAQIKVEPTVTGVDNEQTNAETTDKASTDGATKQNGVSVPIPDQIFGEMKGEDTINPDGSVTRLINIDDIVAQEVAKINSLPPSKFAQQSLLNDTDDEKTEDEAETEQESKAEIAKAPKAPKVTVTKTKKSKAEKSKSKAQPVQAVPQVLGSDTMASLLQILLKNKSGQQSQQALLQQAQLQQLQQAQLQQAQLQQAQLQQARFQQAQMQQAQLQKILSSLTASSSVTSPSLAPAIVPWQNNEVKKMNENPGMLALNALKSADSMNALNSISSSSSNIGQQSIAKPNQLLGQQTKMANSNINPVMKVESSVSSVPSTIDRSNFSRKKDLLMGCYSGNSGDDVMGENNNFVRQVVANKGGGSHDHHSTLLELLRKNLQLKERLKEERKRLEMQENEYLLNHLSKLKESEQKMKNRVNSFLAQGNPNLQIDVQNPTGGQLESASLASTLLNVAGSGTGYLNLLNQTLPAQTAADALARAQADILSRMNKMQGMQEKNRRGIAQKLETTGTPDYIQKVTQKLSNGGMDFSPRATSTNQEMLKNILELSMKNDSAVGNKRNADHIAKAAAFIKRRQKKLKL